MEKKIDEIIGQTPIRSVHGALPPSVASLAFDSRSVAPRSLFFALKGERSDGHDYIPAAVAAGACAVVCERLPEACEEQVCYLEVEDAHAALGEMAANFYDRPAERLRLVGVTGTNGKTTTATLLCETVRMLGYRAGLISTIECRIGSRTIPSTHTTPDPLRLNSMLHEMVAAGCDYCFMEVSSHSIVQQRIRGLRFAGGIFTNITHDHLDYHKTFAAYIRAKKGFFDALPADSFALVNADDRNGPVMVQNTRAQVHTYALRSQADYCCRILETHFEGMELRIDAREAWVHFLGRFNAYNLTAVYGAARLLGFAPDETLRAISALHPVSGRFETIRSADGVTAIVDYAHTPDALHNVLGTIAEIRRKGQKILTVAGCGGDRDRTKRPEMARIAVRESDVAILTSDNPRLEDPEAILDEMCAGLEPGERYLRIADRREAIRTAVQLAAPGDVILIAGKGHENYQDAGGVKHPFDDREQVREHFALLRGKGKPN